MRAQELDNNDDEVYNEWPAQRRMKVISRSIEKRKGLATSARRGLLDILAGSDRRRFGSSDTSRGRSHSILDLLGHRQECLLNVGGVLRRGFKEGDVQLIGKFLRNAVLDDLLTGQVGLVTDEELVNAFGGITINLLEPLLDVGEGVAVSNIVNHDDTMGTTVVRGRNGPEPFLSRSIPNLKFDGLSLQLNSPNLEINTDGGDVALRISVVSKPEEQARLSDA